ncbi:CRISPR system precrRNA processing endoribonuclease RAMP protein Cas6 [Candidatus Bathyarchaeota archaeon]|nr:CRISPR system precrRNA processing endoribonuclease RAMP protein Cas6 [Candidatus Bathyarchaeota archaeon]MBS7618152.1 CRISPR system precrRNA processing endoribonuclease RAMP protein Cas6 [Candidatus Bathyarchaeota archaeon]
MSSISSFTLRLVVEEPVAFQSFSGFASCGVFYGLIKSVDAHLAEELHSSKKLAPWVATPIFREAPPPCRVVYRALSAPSIVNVTFTIMDQKVSEVFKEAILKPSNGNREVELVKVKAKIVSVAVNTKRFSEIADSKPLPKKFAMRFLTPTAFRRSVYDCCPACPHYVEYMIMAREGRRVEKPCKYAVKCGGVSVPLPIPSLMFRNLARIWSAFSSTRLDVWSSAQWAGNAILLAGFPKPGIRTVRVYEHPTTNKWITGFMGTVRFAVKEDMYEEKYAKIAAALLKMAELTNLGVRRTAGLGMVKYVPLQKEDKTD